ncbi:hypothetical protein BDV27DRAFT_152050 [Aspergillus caelatus]|uniref:NAD(P)-binding protein n=1 Tax=Aspergillus caelatus TaxID=61420 RepID=A0A5N7AKR9_9EURO|nr:uncharacterized protein BDV27DRAFT_152050 [Aspergillus caelatus]KAE8370457.1 hypothetical protein BDV27DRAFT_152050 [Aspergillus caelatus]
MPYPPIRPQVGTTFTPTVHHDTYSAINPVTCQGSVKKSVLVTGAGKGMGRCTVVSYAKSGASRIAVCARKIDEAQAACDAALEAVRQAGLTASPQMLPLEMDVCDQRSVAAAVAILESSWNGGLDILVNNAGYLAEFLPLAEGDGDDRWRTWEVNVHGWYNVTKALLPLLLMGKDKTIVNVSSVGSLALTPGASAYQASKFALNRLTEYLMVDYIDQGLLSYAVHPASVPTALATRMPSAVIDAFCNDRPELACDCIAWLTSERREWLAGRYVSCTWDMAELEAKREEIIGGVLLKLKLTI